MKTFKKLLGMTLLASPFIGLFTWCIIEEGFINFLFFIIALALIVGIMLLGMHLMKKK